MLVSFLPSLKTTEALLGIETINISLPEFIRQSLKTTEALLGIETFYNYPDKEGKQSLKTTEALLGIETIVNNHSGFIDLVSKLLKPF